MKKFIKKHQNKILVIGIYLLLIILTSFLNILFLPANLARYFIFITNIVLLFIISFKNGKKKDNKGYKTGLKIGIIAVLIFNIINLLFIRNPYCISRVLYYIIIILVCMFGSVLGINKKAN